MSDHMSVLRAFITTAIVYSRSKDLKLFALAENSAQQSQLALAGENSLLKGELSSLKSEVMQLKAFVGGK